MLGLDLPWLGGSIERVGRPATVKLRRQALAERSRSAAEVARRQGGIVRRGDHLRMLCEWRGSGVGLVRENVEGGPGETSLVERLQECVLVDQRASSDIYEPRARAHRRKCF